MGTPKRDPQIVTFPYHEDPYKVPALTSETPILKSTPRAASRGLVDSLCPFIGNLLPARFALLRLGIVFRSGMVHGPICPSRCFWS